jgi:hypothetical protein
MVRKPNQNLLDCPRDARQNSKGQMSRLRKDAQGLTPSKRCYLQRQSLTELLKLLILLKSLGEALAAASARDPLALILGPFGDKYSVMITIFVPSATSGMISRLMQS